MLYQANMTKDKKLDNFKYCSQAISLKQSLESSFMTLAGYLYRINSEELYKPQWSSWDEFYNELKISKNTANKLVQIHSTMIVEYQFTPEEIVSAGGWSVIQDILPLCTSRKNAEKWLRKAEVLTRDDLRDEMKEEKTGVAQQHCKHLNTYTITICRDCGEKIEDNEHSHGKRS